MPQKISLPSAGSQATDGQLKPSYIIGGPQTQPQKGIAPHPLLGMAHVRNVDITTNPGSIRLNNLPEKKSGSVVTGQITWTRRDPVSGNIFAIDDANAVYLSTDSGATWILITGNNSGIGQGLEVWKGYLIATYSSGLDVYGPIAGIAGPGTITTVGTAITGSGTNFGNSNDLRVGDTVLVNGQYRFVASVSTTTSATLNAAFSPDLSGSNYTFFHWTKGFKTTSDGIVTSQNETFRQLFKSIDGNLYHANGKYVHKLSEATTFDPASSGTYTWTSKAITLADNYEIRVIRDLGSNLMLGTLFAQSTSIADIFPYDRTNLTLGIPIRIVENGIRAMYTYNNRLYVIAGLSGKLFVTDTVSAQQIEQIPNYLINLDGGGTLNIFPDAIMYSKGKLYFGVGNSTLGNAGVWSYNLSTKALQLENTISTGEDGSNQAVYISSLQPIDLNSFLISWRDAQNSAYGIDKVNNTLRYTSYAGYVESQLVKVGEALGNKTYSQLEVTLVKPLVSNQGVRIKWRKDLNSAWTTLATIDYANYPGIVSKNIPSGTITNAVMLQIRAELTTGSSNLSPELQSVMLK